MKTVQPVRVTFINGDVKTFNVSMFNLYPEVIAKIDMSRVAGIEYGEAIVDKGPVEIKLSDVTTVYRHSEDSYYIDLYDRNDNRVAFVKAVPHKLQQFAVNILQQTTYRLEDLAKGWKPLGTVDGEGLVEKQD